MPVDGQNFFSRMMGMDDSTWQRHASPWSVWTRALTGLPSILLPLWSFHWIGWLALLPLSLGVAWIWLNPRLFKVPASTDNWGSKVTFGERIWLNRKSIPIPQHHVRWAFVLSAASGVAFLLALVGIYMQDAYSALTGAIVSWLTKMWFCDRMVWLYQDVAGTNEEYSGWLRVA